MISRKLTAFLLASAFFLIGVITLPHYGINWDTINHLPRGQAYLNYFLTGKKDYSNLPESKTYYQNPKSLSINANIPKNEVTGRSFYQNSADFKWFVTYDGAGHPPVSDILSSIFNKVLFGKLGIINDIDSYRVYGIFLAALLVGLVFWWGSEIYGSFAGLLAALSLAFYPLFWSESHFNNEKDVPETAFWSFMLFSIWKGVTRRSVKWLLLSGVFFGLALGTKFNILFLIPVVLPWLAFSIKKSFFKNRKVILAMLAIPVIGVGIFIASWPYLWPDLITRTVDIIRFYKTIGTTVSLNPRFAGLFGINTYPVQWITYTTPLVILAFFILGAVLAFSKIRQEKNKASLLILLWFIIPIVRVVWPGATIYGGVRQIMEYVPAMAMLSGMGGSKLRDWLSSIIGKKASAVIVILCFVPILLKLIQIHPNENAYFNSIIGGLSGAKGKNIPSWGNTFGAAYRQGIVWINENAEGGAKLVLVNELMPNVPTIWVRPDISFHNAQRSGFIRAGEYAITITYEGISTRSYFDSYLENFMEPVYQSKVDGVAVVKVWKNDENHAYEEYKEQRLVDDVRWKASSGIIEADLGIVKRISYVDIPISSDANCKKLEKGTVFLSTDKKTWRQMKDGLPTGQISIYRVQPNEERLLYSFLTEQARYIRISFAPNDACLNRARGGKVYELPN